MATNELDSKQEQKCPQCGSFKTWAPRKGLIWGGAIFALLSLPWVFIIIGIFPLIAGLLVMLSGFAVPKGQRRCRNCKYKWTPIFVPSIEEKN